MLLSCHERSGVSSLFQYKLMSKQLITTIREIAAKDSVMGEMTPVFKRLGFPTSQ